MAWQYLSRLVAPALLAACGIAAVIYGAKYHAATVFEPQEVQETVKIPVPFAPPSRLGGSLLGGRSPWGGGPGDAAPSPDDQDAEAGPAFITQAVTRIEMVSKLVFEPRLVRELTVGGVEMVRDPEAEDVDLEPGSLRQTYLGEPPALCPT